MKFIKLKRKWMDKEDNVYDKDTVLEVSDDLAKSLIDEGRADATDEIVKAQKSDEDVQKEIETKVQLAVKEALKEVKAEKEEKEDKNKVGIEAKSVEVVEDAPLWKDTGDFLSAVIKASKGNVDERLYKGDGEGQEEATNSEGGYLVEHRLISGIQQAAAQGSVLLNKCKTMEVGPNANGVKIPQVDEDERSATTLFGGIRIYSPAEGAAINDSVQKYTQKDVSLGKLAAVNHVTDELLQDRTGLASFVAGGVGNAFAWYIDDDIINANTNAAMNPIVDDSSTVEVTVAGDNPTAAELTDMYISMLPRAVGRAEWYMSSSQWAAIMQLEDTNGNKIIQPRIEVSPYGTLFGRPVNVIEQAGADTDESSLMFLDLSHYLVIKKGGLKQAKSMHVKFLEDEMSFRWTMRLGSAPLLASKVTMRDGTVKAPFVTRD
ncbi:MAG: phage major capsid protein [bacterium]